MLKGLKSICIYIYTHIWIYIYICVYIYIYIHVHYRKDVYIICIYISRSSRATLDSSLQSAYARARARAPAFRSGLEACRAWATAGNLTFLQYAPKRHGCRMIYAGCCSCFRGRPCSNFLASTLHSSELSSEFDVSGPTQMNCEGGQGRVINSLDGKSM